MSQYIKTWNKRKLIGEISGRVTQNMELAAEFAAQQAKSLAPVRTGKLRDSIVGVVETRAHGEGVEGIVGVKAEKFYARFVELGTRKSPAHPFLRPAVFDHAKEIVRIIQTGR